MIGDCDDTLNVIHKRRSSSSSHGRGQYLHILQLSTPTHMTGLLHEGIFNVQGLIKPANFEGSPWAYVMCNWAQILICWRHWPTEYRKWPFMVLGRIYGHSDLGHKFGHKFSISSHIMIQAVVNMIWGACNHHVTSPVASCCPL